MQAIGTISHVTRKLMVEIFGKFIILQAAHPWPGVFSYTYLYIGGELLFFCSYPTPSQATALVWHCSDSPICLALPRSGACWLHFPEPVEELGKACFTTA